MSVPIAHLIFFAALFYASIQDFRTKEVGDYIHVIIAITAFVGSLLSNIPAMLLGALVSALPLFIAGMLKSDSIGGADIKLMAASGLFLGAAGGMIALVAGLLLGVVCTFVYRKLKGRDMKTSFPLVPFLSAGCVIAYLL